MQTDNQQPYMAVVNIAQVFAHSIVYFAREQTGHVADLYAMGDPAASTATETTDEAMKAYIKNLEPLLRVTSANVLPTEQALVDAQRQISPQKSQLELDLLKEYGPQFAEAGAGIAGQSAMSQAQNDLNVLQGPGRDLAREASAVAREADPEYYKGRELGLAALQNLFGSLDDPNGGLSGAEREEVTRSLNRDNAARGNVAPSAESTVANAMKFGAAGDARKASKQQRLASAIGTATGFLPAAQSKVDTFQLVTGRPSQNFGQDRMSGVQQVGQNTFGMGSQLFGATNDNAQQANQINSQRKSALDKAMQYSSSLASSAASIF